MAVERFSLNIPELHAMYQKGWSMKALAKLVGCNRRTIGDRFRRANLPIELYSLRCKRDLDVPKLYALYQEGWSLNALAKLAKCHSITVAARFRREQLPITPFHHKIGPKYLGYWMAQGMSQSDIARRLGVHRVCVARRVIKYRKQGLLPPGRPCNHPRAKSAHHAPAPSDDAKLDAAQGRVLETL